MVFRSDREGSTVAAKVPADESEETSISSSVGSSIGTGTVGSDFG